MELVWIIEEKCWGNVIRIIPDHCLVRYQQYGHDVEEWFENDEVTDIRDMGIEYELEKDL